MRGSIRSRGGNSWNIQVYLEPGPDGKRKRSYETVIGKKVDAQKRLNELLVNLDKGILPPSSKMTVAQLFESWLSGYVKTHCSPKTYSGYAGMSRNHILPAFGTLLLRQLQPAAIQAYYGRAIEKLSPRTVHKHHRLLSEAMKYAVRQGYLGRNPLSLVDAPSWKRRTMRTLTQDEVLALLDEAKSNYYYPVYYTALSSGLRQAELLGLRWRDLDLDMGSISVTQVLSKHGGVTAFKEPKTAHSRRRVAMTNKLALFLRGHKVGQVQVGHQVGRKPSQITCRAMRKP